ncbi:hypothetical protein BTM21_09810 [Clostridium chauvoei]|nr:hypothetical protein BTM21_09810 [Clostridium chauvoei]
MNVNFNVIKNNIRSIFNYKTIILNILVFLLLFSFQLDLIKESSPTTLFQYITYCFYGVDTVLENISASFSWLMFQLLFILIIIQYINNEFQGRNIYLISRLKSKQNWFLNLELTLILASIIYFFIGFLTLIACSKLLATSLQFSNKEIYAFIIIFLNSLFYVNFYLFTIILLKHNKYSLLGLILLIFINIDLGSVLKIDLYNPFTQCIF